MHEHDHDHDHPHDEHPGQFETARREEVVLQKFLDAFRLNAMVDELPPKTLVEL